MNFILPEKLRKDLLDFLYKQPCGEVMNGVILLQNLEKIEEKEREKDVKKT
jgi:hypothetical protein